MVHYPNETEPYIWLQEKEEEGSADCGCRLEQDNGAKLTLCTMHAAAPELLEALSKVLARNIHGLSIAHESQKEEARALLRKAMGQVQ